MAESVQRSKFSGGLLFSLPSLLSPLRGGCDRQGLATCFNVKSPRCQGGEEKNAWTSRFQPFLQTKAGADRLSKENLSSNFICCYCSLWNPLQTSQELERYFPGNTHKQINKLSWAENNLNIWEPAQACQASHRHSGTGKINLQPLLSVPESRNYITYPLYRRKMVSSENNLLCFCAQKTFLVIYFTGVGERISKWNYPWVSLSYLLNKPFGFSTHAVPRSKKEEDLD